LHELAVLAARASEPVSLRLELPAKTTPFAERLARAAHLVEEGTDGEIPLSVETSGGYDSAPTLALRVGGRDAIRYRSVPEGPEAQPFLDALTALAGVDRTGRSPSLGLQAHIVVFVAAECPNCPHAVRAANGLAVMNPHVTTTVVDAGEFSEEAAAAGVRSVPMTAVDNELTVVGVISEADLAGRILDSHGPDGERMVFSSLLEAGRFSDAGRWLADGRGLDAFADLWRSSGLETRIGLAITADEALGRDPHALDGVARKLTALLESADPATRGDTADLLGKIGEPSAKNDLESLLSDPVEDVAEAAEEALARIRAQK
jgi:glutaredoxin